MLISKHLFTQLSYKHLGNSMWAVPLSIQHSLAYHRDLHEIDKEVNFEPVILTNTFIILLQVHFIPYVVPWIGSIYTTKYRAAHKQKLSLTTTFLNG